MLAVCGDSKCRLLLTKTYSFLFFNERFQFTGRNHSTSSLRDEVLAILLMLQKPGMVN